MRRTLSGGIVVFVAAAFAVAALTGGTGALFLASLVSAAGVLIVVVFLVAFSGGRGPQPVQRGDDFRGFEEAADYATRGRLLDGGLARNSGGVSGDRPENEGTKSSARAFVSTLVPMPAFPPTMSTAAARSGWLEDLRREGRGLIRLAKVTGIDVTAYQAFLADARKAALRGDGQATLRSLQIANELLRATIEKFLFKRKMAGQDTRDFGEL